MPVAPLSPPVLGALVEHDGAHDEKTDADNDGERNDVDLEDGSVLGETDNKLFMLPQVEVQDSLSRLVTDEDCRDGGVAEYVIIVVGRRQLQGAFRRPVVVVDDHS